MQRRCALAVAAVLLVAGCGTSPPRPTPVAAPSPTPSPTQPPTPAPRVTRTAPVPRVVEVRYRVERRVPDAPEFARVVDTTLHDARGWQRAGFRLVEDPRASYVVMLVEPDEAQARCEPYDVYRKYSCQNGPLVVLNAERWRHATPEWTGSLAAYRQMLVNHEVGHLLGQHHPPSPQCPRRGVRARVMSQQSTELNGCLPNPWPLPQEISRAARHDLPLAPPPD